VRAQLDRFSHLLAGGTAASRRKRAIATLSGIVGALMLARAVEDPALSDEILTVARDAFGEGRPSSQNDSQPAAASTA
jgi:TetR/AcrR family transcriptional repressor of nem operon